MVALNPQHQIITTCLRDLGYRDSLLVEGYRFSDWFDPKRTEVEVAAAAFGQTPISYDTACIGVVQSNGLRGNALINRCRSLGAPVVLEIDGLEVREWAVSRKENGHEVCETVPLSRVSELFARRAQEWKPESLFRAKNIGSYRWIQQLGLFTGLLPELEDRIQESLDPLLRSSLSQTRSAYLESTGREPDSKQLFKLVFWLLTAKVFADRNVNGFGKLARQPDADRLLAEVAKHYRQGEPRLLNREARQVAAECIWNPLDFRNLSVEVLAQIWSRTLLDTDTKRRLGIHRTSRSIVRYIVDRIPFQNSGDDRKIIVEPCCGSAVFLIGAMNKLRHSLFGASPSERHAYYVNHLAGIEKDPFGAEISRLALTLSDFPNSDGWDIANEDVFNPGILEPYMSRAGVVLCNPPFADFTTKEKSAYRPDSAKKPVELLNRVLDSLHPQAVLGFVLPRQVVDGLGYRGVRRRIADRFAHIELTILPDKAFDADAEIGLLIATDPIPHTSTRIVSRKVTDSAAAWSRFELSHETSSEYLSERAPNDIEKSLAIPELPDIWNFLKGRPTLDSVAELHRGIEWNLPLTKKVGGQTTETGNRSRLVLSKPREGFVLGVPPNTSFNVFERPNMRYLNMRPSDQRGSAFTYEWTKPKVILNKASKSRQRWRLAAYPDSEGLVCYQSFIGVWPTTTEFDEIVLAAILNSPVANAFVSTREGKVDITIETLKMLPVPNFNEQQRVHIRDLVYRYQTLLSKPFISETDAARILMEIDATVLDGYRMPPRLEQQLLEFFRNAPRPTSHEFGNYLPEGEDVYFSLSDRLKPEYKEITVGALLRRIREHD